MVAQAPEDGPTVVVMGAVHPDETAGTEIMHSLPQTLDFKRGKVIAILANLDAMPAQVRQTEANMNRSFRPETLDEKLRNPSDLPSELRRTQEIMDLIKQERPAALLDIHEYEGMGMPNIICDRESLPLARTIGAKAIILGFNVSEPGGSDGFAHEQGIPALCYEVGTQGGAFQRQNVTYGREVVRRFLAAEGLTDERPKPLYDNPILAKTTGEQIITHSDHFRLLLDNPRWFELLPPGTPVAIDGDHVLKTDPKKWQSLMFIKPHVVKGREPFAPVDILEA
jgi:predicted deacylase